MLFKRAVLDAIVRGEVDLAYRTWRAPRVKAGTRMRTAIGVLEAVSVGPADAARISARDARRAGYASAEALRAVLAEREGTVYRIELRHAGDDPRVGLRADDTLGPQAAEELRRRLGRLDAASRHGAWTLKVLTLIAGNPGVSSAALAPRAGRERHLFKADVRKLKELGLTESLDVGYRLSPRGEAVLCALRARPSEDG
ncbi:hypothetical protein ACIBCM_31215 [Streptomyces sp. NPDC051018]|uniref:hypothetical protein n=1 Tax=Streptomyces sp. NPDC051018 TaxID=3365639 RepID=UPI0037A2760F